MNELVLIIYKYKHTPCRYIKQFWGWNYIDITVGLTGVVSVSYLHRGYVFCLLVDAKKLLIYLLIFCRFLVSYLNKFETSSVLIWTYFIFDVYLRNI